MPFLKINEYNKNTQSNIFNTCTQEVIRGCVNWMETNLAMQSKTTKHSFLTMRKFGPEPVPVPWNTDCICLGQLASNARSLQGNLARLAANQSVHTMSI